MDSTGLFQEQEQLKNRLETWETEKKSVEEQVQRDAHSTDRAAQTYRRDAGLFSTHNAAGVREKYRYMGLADYAERKVNRNRGAINQAVFEAHSAQLTAKKNYKNPELSQEDLVEINQKAEGDRKKEKKYKEQKKEKIRKEANKTGAEAYERAKNAYKSGGNAYITNKELDSEWAEKNIFSKKRKTSTGEKKTNKELFEAARNGDYSELEALDEVLRNRLAFEYLENFTKSPHADPQALVDSIYDKQGVSGLLNPLLRLGLSLASKMKEPENTFENLGLTKEQCAEFDELLSKRVMEETITKQPTMEEMNRLYGSDTEAIKESVERNINSQVFTAKLLFMAHLGRMKKKERGKEPADWDLNVSTAFAHCSRVGIVLPGKKGKEFNKSEQNRMIDSITGAGQGLEAGFFKRGGATHDLNRKSKTKANKNFKEKKTPLGTYSNQFGMNVAVGGLGTEGIGGPDGVNRQLNNDGSCGHLYMHKQQGDAETYPGMLVGFESDAYKKTNQLGHTHGLGNGEFASSFGSQRMDEHGDKYGGREIDLTGLSTEFLENLMNEFDAFYRDLLTTPTQENVAILQGVASKLTGKLMNNDDLNEFMRMFHK